MVLYQCFCLESFIMSTAISEAVYSTERRLPRFEQHVFIAAIHDLCQIPEAFTQQMILVLPLLMKSSWKGTAPPNTESLFGDIKSVFLKIYNERKSEGQNGRAAELALYEMLRMDDPRIRSLLYEMRSTRVKLQKHTTAFSSKEKIDPWKRRIVMLNAAFAYWMVTHQYIDRYWALTKAKYEPEQFADCETIKRSNLPASVQFSLHTGKSAEVITFLSLSQKQNSQNLRFSKEGYLEIENNWN